LRPDIDDLEEAEPLAPPARNCESVVVREQDDLLPNRLLEPGEILGEVILAPRLVRDLLVEGLPQLAHERQVVGGRGADHGLRNCASR
jgi:hypothetical protein